MSDDKDVAMDDKDVLMEGVAEAGESDVVGDNEPVKLTENLDDSMKDIRLENPDEIRDYDTGKETVDEKADITVAEDDAGAASDAEFAVEDDRSSVAGEIKWRWHIEMYPICVDDLQLDNFLKMCNIATHFQIFFRTNLTHEKKGEVHLYTEDMQAAKNIVRTMCCRKFSNTRPFVYIYRRKEQTSEDYEMASLRLDLVDAAKMRWDRQKKSHGEASSRTAKVSNIALGTSRELLNVVFARAFRVKGESDKSVEEGKQSHEKAKKTDKDENSEKATEGSSGDGDGKERTEESPAEEKEESIAQEEDMVGEFNGTVTVDCSSRTSLKGFLLGYRRVVINENLVAIEPFNPGEVDESNLPYTTLKMQPKSGLVMEGSHQMEAIRQEARQKRKEEAVRGKEWVPASPPRPHNTGDQTSPVSIGRGRAGHSYRGGRGRGGMPHGGRGSSSNPHRGGGQGVGWSRGGMVMTGRQKMNEKSIRRGAGPIRDIRGLSSFSHEIMMLQSQLQMNTIELQRQIASLNAAEHMRDFHADYPRDFRRDYQSHGYGMPRHGGWADSGWDYPEPGRGRHGAGRKPRGNRR